MAPGPAFEIPRLPPACLDPFRPSASDSGAFTLARNLLLAGVGDPDDWQESNSDPVKFMLRTLTKEAARFNQHTIDSVAHTSIVFGTHPTTGGWRERENINTNRVFLAVEATHISVVYLRDIFDLLAKIDPRLAVTFYRMLLQSLSEWILCYDESAAAPYIEYRIECYEEAKASGEDEEGLEAPQTLEAAKGPWLADHNINHSPQDSFERLSHRFSRIHWSAASWIRQLRYWRSRARESGPGRSGTFGTSATARLPITCWHFSPGFSGTAGFTITAASSILPRVTFRRCL
jgi:hypothetical protein